MLPKQASFQPITFVNSKWIVNFKNAGKQANWKGDFFSLLRVASFHRGIRSGASGFFHCNILTTICCVSFLWRRKSRLDRPWLFPTNKKPWEIQACAQWPLYPKQAIKLFVYGRPLCEFNKDEQQQRIMCLETRKKWIHQKFMIHESDKRSPKKRQTSVALVLKTPLFVV